ncbi:hypothetical protein I203_103621 [Kwoniella mangroviensis CBS 8507]|uniref:uncharacterized protein n=1 Tax=Kwoniella mangroviensis CBS 8507 TaxID=1296122 RepID=UPI00080D3CED|nr:uncharacterized protein I203_04283 [Kwoniella mangroviensis CBS 8507]OCF66707.1 hypothetical protein I203_04283 [Kwoniella mangroviensis CBS 8507]
MSQNYSTNNSQDESDNQIYIYVGVTVGVLVVLALPLLYIFYLRRKGDDRKFLCFKAKSNKRKKVGSGEA